MHFAFGILKISFNLISHKFFCVLCESANSLHRDFKRNRIRSLLRNDNFSIRFAYKRNLRLLISFFKRFEYIVRKFLHMSYQVSTNIRNDNIDTKF